MITKNIYRKVCGLALAALTFTACSDTWDDHYEGTSDGVLEGSLWQAIENDANLSNFASVMKACGFDKSLASSQVFTVFAPTNDSFSAEEAAELIAAYNAEKNEVDEEDNTIIKEFVKNHIALYNHSIAPGVLDSLLLMNGKRVQFTENNISDVNILKDLSNRHYENGMLFVIDKQIQYLPNVFEYLRKDPDLDSLRSFMYSKRFYRREFEPSLSVPGEIVEGKTTYLDSVFTQVNELYSLLDALLTREDSTYWMLAPTNEAWRQLIEDYEPYFNYAKTTVDRDSFVYTFTRLAIMQGAFFSETLNRQKALQDSAISTEAVRTDWRESYWGAPFLRYYQYGSSKSDYNPIQSGNVLGDLNNPDKAKLCSNGTVIKTSQWNINPLNTFKQVIIIPATSRSYIQDMSKKLNSSKELEEIVAMSGLDIPPSSPYYDKLWGNRFMQFRALANEDVFYRFSIPNVLSNMGYDIYLVTAPILANDSNATAIQRLPAKFDATMCYLDENGKKDSTVLVTKQTTQEDVFNYILLAEDFKFPCCTYSLRESTPQVSLKINTNVTPIEYRRSRYTRTMNIAYILLVPHGTDDDRVAWTDDDYFYIKPHGDNETFKMSKGTDLLKTDEQ